MVGLSLNLFLKMRDRLGRLPRGPPSMSPTHPSLDSELLYSLSARLLSAVSLSSSSPDEETEDDVDGTDEAKNDRKDRALPEPPLFVPCMISTCRSQLAHARAHSSSSMHNVRQGTKRPPRSVFQGTKLSIVGLCPSGALWHQHWGRR